MRFLQNTMALLIAEHEAMRKRLIELEEVCEDKPVRWRGSGEPIVNLSEEVHNFLKQKSEELRENERRAEQRHKLGFGDN
jgi:hypothetical protein